MLKPETARGGQTLERAILIQRNLGNGAAVGDCDADGDLDLYLLAQLGRPRRLVG